MPSFVHLRVPLRLLPERRRDQTRQNSRPGPRSRHASGGHHRHREPVRRAGILAVLHGQGRAADHRLPGEPDARRRRRSRSAAGTGCDWAGQFAAAVLGGVPDQRSGGAAAGFRRGGGVGGRADAADRGHARAAGQAAGGGARAGGGCAAGPHAGGVRRPAGRRASSAWAAGGARDRARADRAGGPLRRAPGGDERVLFPPRPRCTRRTMRCCASPKPVC